MLNLKPQNILSMTDLQKLSFKKMAGLKLSKQPILVMDKKSNTGAFVILSYDNYETLLNKDAGQQGKQTRPSQIKIFNFKKSGLFWDRPKMTNMLFAKILMDKKHHDHAWAVTRTFERLPSQVILEILPFETVVGLFNRAQLREPLKGAWKNAITYWNQKA